MKFVKFLIIIFLSESNLLSSQVESYRENAWLSFVWKHSFSENWNVTTDLGYRTFDHFIIKRRQDLARVLFERKIDNNQNLDLGVAYFESIILNTDTYNREFRPFIQYQYHYKIGKSKLGLRFRNELRYYQNSNTYVDRSRLQLSYDYVLIEKYVNPRITIEEFISTGASRLVEQRYSIGNLFSFSDLFKSYVFYTLQLQSNIKDDNGQVLQHVFGVQIQLNTNKK